MIDDVSDVCKDHKMKKNDHKVTITFRPSHEVWEQLALLTAPFTRNGKVARGILSYLINDGLEQAFARGYEPKHDEPNKRGSKKA